MTAGLSKATRFDGLNDTLCSNCIYPDKKLWAIGPPYPKWTVIVSDWTGLVKCAECNQLWAEGHYEPHGAFRYAVVWPLDKETFLAVLNRDAGLSLGKWHEAEIRLLAKKADEQTLKHIDAHYRRSSGYVNLMPSDNPNPVRLTL